MLWDLKNMTRISLTDKRKQYIRQKASELLLNQRLYSLKFNILKFKFDKNIIIDTLESFCLKTNMPLSEVESSSDFNDGITLLTKEGISIILFNSRQPNKRRIAFTLAHELGHIYLGHKNDTPLFEAEANYFARELLAPSVLVDKIISLNKDTTSRDIHDIFNISVEAAGYSLCGKAGELSFSQSEIKLLNKCKNFIPAVANHIVTF